MPVIALVRFTPHSARTNSEDKTYLDQVMPMFEGTNGLKRKYFCATQTGGMGVYEWVSEKAARDYYSDEWRSQIETMANDVEIEIMRLRAIVDNENLLTKTYI